MEEGKEPTKENSSASATAEAEQNGTITSNGSDVKMDLDGAAATGKTERSGAGAKTEEQNGAETKTENDGTTDAVAPPKNNDGDHRLRVKAEYILRERPAWLAPLPEGPTCFEPLRKGKKRPRDKKESTNVCLPIVRGDACPRSEGQCKYSHDLKALLKTRAPDITELEGGCPNYKLYGKCQYGILCRFGSSHCNLETGENLESPEKPTAPPPTMNVMPRDLLLTMRKKKYTFKYSYEKPQKKKEGKCSDKPESNVTTQEPSSAPLPPQKQPEPNLKPVLPAKERKLIDFRGKVYIAPLTTVGNLPFRRIMKKFGADITCGEMAMAQNLLQGQFSEWALLKRHPSEDVFGVQLASAYQDQFIRASEVIEKHCEVDFVDLNLGCPLDLVCKPGGGAGLMLRDKRLRESVIGMVNTLSCPVTIKMRMGWEVGRPIAHKLVQKIQGWEQLDGSRIAAVMIHGRSRQQRYSKSADWDYISQVATSQLPEKAKIPVIGNGDIFSFTDYEEKIKREGIEATAMLGRGALIKPWLPTEIKERRHWDISALERFEMLKEFVRFGLDHWGSDQQGVNKTRRFLLEWLSFLYRYVPVALLEVLPQQMNQRPPKHMRGRNDLETLMLSPNCFDWIKISEMLLGPVPEGFEFDPKHKSNAYKG